LTVRLIQKICEICKTICVHESIFNNESNDMKMINNYLNFLNKTNGQIYAKKSTASNISKRLLTDKVDVEAAVGPAAGLAVEEAAAGGRAEVEAEGGGEGARVGVGVAEVEDDAPADGDPRQAAALQEHQQQESNPTASHSHC
jgi:hypothetical protein